MDHRERIQQSLDYIEENLKTDISAAELAQMAGYSVYHYYRLFQAAVGLPVMQYILRRRLLHGIYAIKQGSSAIAAALCYGFDTYGGFYKAFQREFGCSPSTFLLTGRAKRPYRPDLFREELITVNHKKVREILKYWDLETETITDIYNEETGNKKENACYIGAEYVLKYTTNLGSLKTSIAMAREMENIGLLSAAAIAASGGEAYIQEGDVYYWLTRRLPGRRIRAGSLYEGDGAEKARFVGEIIGQLHLALNKVELCAQEENLLETVCNWALPKAAAVLGWPAEFCRTWLDAFAQLYEKLPRQIIHRDPNPGNIICGEAHWGFIDFELSQRNVRLFDPCYAATAVLSETVEDETRWEQWPEIYRNIMLGYDSVAVLTPEEKQAAPYLILANQLVCVAWFSEQEKYTELLEINKRMTCWITAHLDLLAL